MNDDRKNQVAEPMGEYERNEAWLREHKEKESRRVAAEHAAIRNLALDDAAAVCERHANGCSYYVQKSALQFAANVIRQLKAKRHD